MGHVDEEVTVCKSIDQEKVSKTFLAACKIAMDI
jgi:hypothetical protein